MYVRISEWWVHSYLQILKGISDSPAGKKLCPKELFLQNCCEVKCLQGSLRISPFDSEEVAGSCLFNLQQSHWRKQSAAVGVSPG